MLPTLTLPLQVYTKAIPFFRNIKQSPRLSLALSPKLVVPHTSHPQGIGVVGPLTPVHVKDLLLHQGIPAALSSIHTLAA